MSVSRGRRQCMESINLRAPACMMTCPLFGKRDSRQVLAITEESDEQGRRLEADSVELEETEERTSDVVLTCLIRY
jgi:hypothetical protein